MTTRATMSQDIQELSQLYISKGKSAMTARLNEIVKERKLKTWEAVVLSSRIRDTLTNNGILIN